uniref:Uncharacterized protein n=1 Tax=Arundo donax TaxID=35708 RepID=A0A0A9BN34_ARUDO
MKFEQLNVQVSVP